MKKIDVLKSIFHVWGQNQDIEALISHLTEDVTWHVAAASKPPVQGHDGARRFLQEYRKKIKSQTWRIFNYAEMGNLLFTEGVDEMITVEGRHLLMPYAGVLEFEGDKIKGWRDYYDPAAAEASAVAYDNGKPPAEHVQVLINRPALPGLGG